MVPVGRPAGVCPSPYCNINVVRNKSHCIRWINGNCNIGRFGAAYCSFLWGDTVWGEPYGKKCGRIVAYRNFSYGCSDQKTIKYHISGIWGLQGGCYLQTIEIARKSAEKTAAFLLKLSYLTHLQVC